MEIGKAARNAADRIVPYRSGDIPAIQEKRIEVSGIIQCAIEIEKEANNAALQAKVERFEADRNILCLAIKESEAWEDGYCIVCGNHTDSHSNDCLMAEEE